MRAASAPLHRVGIIFTHFKRHNINCYKRYSAKQR